jgi:pimeloyl-ACP methyl ester carboxylesterase
MNEVIPVQRPEISTTGRAQKGASLSLRAIRSGMRMLSRVAPEGAAALAERMFLTPRRFPRTRAEVETLAGARRVILPRPWAELAVWEWGLGTREPGPCVLLVHGWEGRGAQLGALVAPLTREGFRVATFDAPAHGDSPGRRSSLVQFAEAIRALAKNLGPLHAIVSHSMGGAAALWASRDALLAQRLVLIAPPIDLRDFTRALSRTLGLPEEIRGRVHGRLGARFGVPVESFRGDVVAADVARRGISSEPDRASLSNERRPASLLVVHDEQDREVPIACGEAIARAWPESELVRTQGLGHQRILRDPSVVATVVRFVVRGGFSDAALVGGA